MNSPLPVEAFDSEPVTPIEAAVDTVRAANQNPEFQPYPNRVPRAGPTLPSVTLRQHRLAALAGGAVTLFALGGFAVLLANAPRSEKMREVTTASIVAPATQDVVPAAVPAPSSPLELADVPQLATATADTTPLTVEPSSAPVQADAADTSPLPADDPRWANMSATAEDKAEALIDETTTEPPSPAVARAMPNAGDDVPVPAARDTTPSDETVAVDEADLAETDTSTTAAIPVSGTASSRAGKATKYVNLRSQPADEGKVLLVVPANSPLTVLACDGWCEVDYKGTRGFIYKSFLK